MRMQTEALQTRPRRYILSERPDTSACQMCEVRGRGLCSTLSDTELDALALISERVKLSSAQIFIEEDAPARYFYNVTSGMVKLYRSLPDGRRQITGFAGPGHFLGLAAVKTYGFGAETIEDSRVCRFSRTDFSRITQQYPNLERRLLAEASHELVIANDQMLLLGRKTARERVASFLLARLEEDFGRVIPEMPQLHLPMIRNDIADFLGLTVETVSRTLSWMRKENMILSGRDHSITIMAPDRLEALAQLTL